MTQRAEYVWKGAEAKKAIRAATLRGMQVWLEFVLQESRTLVPLDEGTLERSGMTSIDEQNMIGAVSYDTVYAVPQHENLDYRHAPGRSAKYLERPWLANMNKLLPIVQKQVRKATKS